MFDAFDFVSSAGESALAFECLDAEALGGSEGQSPFVVGALILLALPVLCAVAATVFWLCLKQCRSRRGDAEVAPAVVFEANHYTKMFIATMLVLLFLLHPTLTRSGLRFFTCSPEDMGGPTFLEADFTMEASVLSDTLG